MSKPLREQRVHMVGREEGATLALFDADVSTLCGKTAAPTEYECEGYVLTDSNGNRLRVTTFAVHVSCQKCTNLLTIGALHVNTPHARRRGRDEGQRADREIAEAGPRDARRDSRR
jgi:hypothetical protein